MSTVKSIIAGILEPKREYTPIPFWFLNDRLERDELKRQLADFNDKGVNAVIPHPRMGLPREPEYLSEGYFDIIEFIAETASELDMKIVLYDEAMYPSGSAHGLVVKSDPQLASCGITLTGNKSVNGGRLLAEFDDGLALVCKKTGGTIRGVHFGEDDGAASAPLSADILNPKAVEKFIELTHERYYSRLKKYFGSTVIGFFTDEPSVTGRCCGGCFGWTEGFEEEFEKRGGKIAELRAMFENKTNDSVLLYRRLIAERLNKVYYGRLSRWCEEHGIWLMGHPAESDDIDEQIYFHVPGQDLIFRRVAPESGGVEGIDSVQAKCSSDAARHLMRRRNSNECFGACSRGGVPWYFTGADMKWYIDWLAVRGVNMFIPHAFFYSVRGKRKDERPPDAGPNNIWWEHYRLFSDYIKRVSYIMTDSKNAACTAVLCRSGDMMCDEVRDFYEEQIEFNYLPYSVLNKAEVKDGRLCIAGYEYKYILGGGIDGVKSISGIRDIKERDFDAGGSCPSLRVTHIIKNGRDMYFAVNEGTGKIDAEVSVPVKGNAVLVDLWHGEFYGLPSYIKNGRTYTHLCIEPYGSALLMFDENEQYPPRAAGTRICPRFVLEKETEYKKTYTAEYIAAERQSDEFFEADFAEMAELRINGVFAGASFFERRFEAGAFLETGKNKITLDVFASAANKYDEADIEFGLIKKT